MFASRGLIGFCISDSQANFVSQMSELTQVSTSENLYYFCLSLIEDLRVMFSQLKWNQNTKTHFRIIFPFIVSEIMNVIVKSSEGLVIVFDFHDFFNYGAETSMVMFRS